MASVMPFLFHQFSHGDKAHKVTGDADALSALPAALVRSFDADAFDKFSQGVGCHFLQILVFICPLDELLQIFDLSFLYFDFLPQGLDFHFMLCLLVLIGLAHQREPFIREFPGNISLIDTDEQPVEFTRTAFRLCQTLLVSPDGFFAGQPEPPFLYTGFLYLAPHDGHTTALSGSGLLQFPHTLILDCFATSLFSFLWL